MCVRFANNAFSLIEDIELNIAKIQEAIFWIRVNAVMNYSLLFFLYANCHINILPCMQVI